MELVLGTVMKDGKMLVSHAAVCLLINNIPLMVVGDKTYNHLNLTVLTCTEMENSFSFSRQGMQ